jgi:hypothetical protein
MANSGFPPDDELLEGVCREEMAMHELNVTANYLACEDTADGQPRSDIANG